jgi:hypothetical protein
VVDAGEPRRGNPGADPGPYGHHRRDGRGRAELRRAGRRALRAPRRARLRGPQRALRLRVPAPRVRARGAQVHGEDAVHGAPFAPPLRRAFEPQSRQPDRAPRHRLPRAPSRAAGCGRGVAVPAHRGTGARRRDPRGRGPAGGKTAGAAAAHRPRGDRRHPRGARRVHLPARHGRARYGASTGSARWASSARCCGKRSS